MSDFIPGKDLDRIVAVEVFGYTFCEHSKVKGVAQSGGWAMCQDKGCKGDLHWDHVPGYSTEIYQAWKVVEKMREYDQESRFAVPTPIMTRFAMRLEWPDGGGEKRRDLYEIMMTLSAFEISRAAVLAVRDYRREVELMGKGFR